MTGVRHAQLLLILRHWDRMLSLQLKFQKFQQGDSLQGTSRGVLWEAGMDVSPRGGTRVFCFFKVRLEFLRVRCRRGRGSIHAPRFRGALPSLCSTRRQLLSSALLA